MTTDTREIEDKLRKWHALYFAEAGSEEPNDGWEFLRDVHLAADALSAARKREEELTAVVAAMSEALAPFAAYADKDLALSDRPSNMGMQVTTGALYMVPQITMGDCYLARQALSLAQLDGGAGT